MKTLIVSLLFICIHPWNFGSSVTVLEDISYPLYSNFYAPQDTTIKDSANPNRFHLYIVLRKKHYHALLTVKDTLDRILLSKEIDSLRVGRNFFIIPTQKKLPPIVKWELKAGDFIKKGKMAIH
ncbi:MAG: hypothetical protein IT267_07565 [Saprospiraceae bacterium]|nr:hypothetical protein [Saprospiraceae bacterium]